MNLTGHISTEGKLLLYGAEKLRTWIKDHADTDVSFSIDIKRKRRSNPQNAYYWDVVVSMVQDGINELGNTFSKDETHEFLKKEFNYKEVEVGEGSYIKIPQTTTKLTTIEFNNYKEKIQQFAATVLGIVIPDPNEQTVIDFQNQ